MPARIGWGILGAGTMAKAFARGLKAVPDARLVAVASRTPGRLQEMGKLFSVSRLYDDYPALLGDRSVDIVYIATTNQLHCELSLLCLEAGKPVLCEKPFALHAAEARAVVECARRRHVFCMEAMWTRFFPLMRALPELLRSGDVGRVRMLRADFGSRMPFAPNHRWFDPALGGGALLDLGVYPLSLAFYLFGRPRAIVTEASIGATGVDEQAAAVLEYATGQIAVISCSIVTRLPTEAFIVGDRGQLRIHHPMYRPSAYSLTRHPAPGDDAPRGLSALASAASGLRRVSTRFGHALDRMRGREPGVTMIPFVGNGYNYEAAEAMRCLRAGETESLVMPLDETLAIMETLDAIRQQWHTSPERTA